jgi:hypothetical protein
MNAGVVEFIKIALMVYIIALLSQILRYMRMVWSKVFDMHIAVVLKEDPKKYGGGKI